MKLDLSTWAHCNLVWCLLEFILIQVAVKDTKGSKPEDEPPPMWFRSYMEKVRCFFFFLFQGSDPKWSICVWCTTKDSLNINQTFSSQFKDEVVKEVVERMCSDFSGQCCTHKSSDEHLEASGASDVPIGPRPGPSTSNGSLGYTPNCSSCNKLTSEGAYKCRYEFWPMNPFVTFLLFCCILSGLKQILSSPF